ncbi:NAD(P)/FAD-dependent oxidoreductase [Thalassospira lucentensis]|uniref:FAD-binding oxidoreductase n=1 Tax=Thalassospira lucentensis TaxID=168935 RepID=A0A358HQ01_9PROT|nr:FAD-binding oxidoreductase [Thalassospira lucentensis]HBU97231.1 FAD-binding oxidoreductase [Thalassospira lucentensis]HCW66660.1 FAD-binding oxidoreductase [Thalassospira lucentensis]
MSQSPSKSKTPNASGQKAVVIGAGIIGVNVALALQDKGYDVTILDRGEPGMGASFGNAGGIAVTECAPIAMPGTLMNVPGWLMDPLGPLSVRWGYLPRMLPWLLRFLAASSKSRVEQIATELAAVLNRAWDDYDPVIAKAGLADAVFKKEGAMAVYRSDASRRKDDYAIDLRRRNGIKIRDLTRAEVRDLEPDLAPIFSCGVMEEDWGRVLDPYKIVMGLYKCFRDQGGEFETADVTDFVYRDGKPRAAMTTSGDQITFDTVVVACGAWSKTLAKRLGSPVPLDTERGYNTTVPYHDAKLSRMVICADDSFVMTPMEMGIRVGGAVELGGLTAAPNYDRAKALFAKGKEVLPKLNGEGGTEWMGFRPSMPDSKPVISKSPNHQNVFFAFGHGHLGLTMAATTGRLISDLVSGEETPINMTPYRINRF